MKDLFSATDRVAKLNGQLKIGTIQNFYKEIGLQKKFNTYVILYDDGKTGIIRESSLILLSDLSNPDTKLASIKWIRFMPISWRLKIIDPDGWDRKNFKFSFYKELITRDEFMKRLCFSTIQCNIKEFTHGSKCNLQ